MGPIQSDQLSLPTLIIPTDEPGWLGPGAEDQARLAVDLDDGADGDRVPAAFLEVEALAVRTWALPGAALAQETSVVLGTVGIFLTGWSKTHILTPYTPSVLPILCSTYDKSGP